MFKNYIKTALRSFSKSIIHVATNVLGLGLGIAMCIIAFMLNSYNAEFNKCYDSEQTRNIHRVEYNTIENSDPIKFFAVNLGQTRFLETDVPGIESVIRFFGEHSTLKVGDDRFGEYMTFCNQAFIETFSFELIEGSYLNYAEPDAIYIREDIAEKYFDDEPAMGKEIELKVKDTPTGVHKFLVRGVFKAQPENSSFSYFDIVTNYQNLYRISENDGTDMHSMEKASETYIKVTDDEVLKKEALVDRLAEHAALKKTEGKAHYNFRPFSEIHKHYDGNVRTGYTNTEIPGEILLTFDLLAFLVLLIACFNYTNYAISMSGNRLKEIGLRKVMGSTRKQIQIQFLAESLIASTVSVLVGVVIFIFLYPVFRDTWGGFDYGIGDIEWTRIIIFMIGITLVMSLISGFYPAQYVSRYSPAAIISKSTKSSNAGWVTHSLVFLQQTITIVGLGASIIFTQNMDWLEEMDIGYDRENLFTVPALNAMENSEVFIERVKQHPKVESAGISWKKLGFGTGDRPITIEGQEYFVDIMETGPNYMETTRVRLKEGRFWRNHSKVDMQANALVNEEFIKVTGIKEPIGKQIKLPSGSTVYVIGVIGDYKQSGPWEISQPTVVCYSFEDRFKFLAVRAKSAEDLKEVDAYCEEQWKELEPFMPYESWHERRYIEGAIDTSRSFKDTFLFTAIVALLLSVGGMFSLVTMMIQKRTKEIAIRKVLGGTVKDILYLVTRRYAIISLIAGILGSVLWVYMIAGLLDNIYDYHIEVNFVWHTVAGLLMLVIALLSISSHSIKAATANPVDGLKYE